MAEVPPIIPITTPNRSYEGHTNTICAVGVFTDGCRMVTGSADTTLRLWDLKDDVLLQKMEGGPCDSIIRAVAVSRDGQLIASGHTNGKMISWQRDTITGKYLAHAAISVHSIATRSLDFSPDGAVLATGSEDKTTKLWNTTTWQLHGHPIICGGKVNCVRYSPSGERLAIGTAHQIEIWNTRTRKCVVKLNVVENRSLAWTPDGKRLLSGGSIRDCTIQEWDTWTWRQVGDSWSGHTAYIAAVTMNSTGALVASASADGRVRLWRYSDRRTIAIFMHSHSVSCLSFSMDGKHIFGGGLDKKMSAWTVPEDALLKDAPKELLPEEFIYLDSASGEQSTSQILTINLEIRNAFIVGHLATAEELLTQEIEVDGNNHNSYANRSLLMARKGDWDNALHDALRSVGIQPSLVGYLSHGIALCGKKLFWDAMKVFDLALMFTDRDPKTIHLLLIVKAIALFNANEHKDAMSRIQALAVACPDVDILAYRVVEAYLHVQLGINAMNDACHNEAIDHFTAAINRNTFLSQHSIHLKYEVFVVLFGWDLKSLWQTANQKRCHALFQADRLAEAQEAHRYMMDMVDEETAVKCRDWSIAFEQECRALCLSSGDAALTAKDCDKAIELYSAVIDSYFAPDSIFASRCTAKLEKMSWEDALVDAQKVIELNPSSYLGYQLKNAALYGAQRYDEAIRTFDTMLSILDHVSDTHVRELRQQYITSAEAGSAIQEVIHAQLENTPHRLLNTITGHICNRGAQIRAFKTSPEYKELVSTTMKYPAYQTKRIKNAVDIYFRTVMLSHRWGENEPLLRNIQDKDVYKLDPVGGVMKLQSFCKTVRDAGYRWAWVDTCCIDQTNNVEVQQSVNSMFVWYRHSALTIVYLLDVPPSSKSGALAMSVWNKRGWTVQEFLAPKIVLFYQNDWTPYLNDRSLNHKDSAAIMQEMGSATCIDRQALVAFHPGMRGAREKLQWVSTRITTVPEDIAYSLFGIFDIHLPVIYGEQKQKALGRLLQEIIAQGDITCLDWVGKSSGFNSCLPADITFYGAPPSALPSLPEGEMQTSVSWLRNAVDVELASNVYQTLHSLSAPLFASRRLRLPCIAFAVTEVRRKRGEDQQSGSTFEVKSDGLRDLLITTEDKLIQFSRAKLKPTRQAFLLVRPWDSSLLELPDFADDTESAEDWSPPASLSVGSLGEHGLVDSESYSRVLRLIVRLGQPFSAFLLAQQRGGEYKRVASDQNIVAQVEDMTAIRNMDVKTLEIL